MDGKRTAAALDFFDFCANETDVTRIAPRFLDDIRSFGFDYCAAGAWLGSGAGRVHRFYFNNWPQDWLEIYEANGFVVDDPLLAETRRRMSDFLWSEIADSLNFAVQGEAVAAAVKAYGWTEVLAIPIHGPASYQALVSLATKKPVELAPVDRVLLRSMAIRAHDRLHAVAGFGMESVVRVHLTPREMDCMRWVAAGKTDAEIGMILGIASTTAHFHVESAKRKLETRSRSEAVGLLTLAGTI